ncbi:Carbamoyl-phosphate synthase large chain [Pseudomonas oleovorans subsp. oleovorans]|uniref:Carbamoyl-phosphate synthase, large subunit n=1 Tax=Ectopseudomonas oleovorans TaxID=301 RepID=A0A379JYR5_ECTOL|nr:ATP-grasp domain-containing protein [Pseudomonas oleovorans]OWK39242.1 Carbamoyl-phosphate synthase large chain [Pseudomonas oleovorans subsp. oleovorans]SEJ69630.1 Biotin carboxylase [Pseudomonas oleovorans]SUD53708.1 carbamoyl-phosphate synthase, large subunit [Pseudomonas oleovorans]
MKKILFLGGAPTQIPPLKYAREQGYYVITCDYLPENPGHKLADEYHNVSTTDKEAVLKLAEQLKIDGIVAYASDPAAPTAAYVAEKMGLPGNPYKSVEILARKDLFRAFLAENGFNVPRSQSFYTLDEAKAWLDEIGVPAFIKPVDSSGSKGVTNLKNKDHLAEAFQHALQFSREKKVVVEEAIVRSGHQVAGDGFIVDGELVFRCWADENFDDLCNGLVPIGQSFPTSHPKEWLDIAHAESQRLLTLLGMKTGALNFDFLFDQDGKFYFLELGPRNGGCQIPEVIRYSTGVDLIKYTVDAAIGLDCSSLSMTPSKGYWSSYMLHSLQDGVFKEVYLSDRAKKYIVEQDIYVKPGDKVFKFTGSHHTLGTMILQYSTLEEMMDMLDHMENDIRVITE